MRPYLVSVILPTFNRPQSLPRALDSLTQQILTDFQVVVVNDGGCPLGSVLRPYSGQLNLAYIRYTPNRGAAAARNAGIRAATGKYICYLDDDDILYPEHLVTLASFLERSQYKVAYTDAVRVFVEKADGRYVTRGKEIFCGADFNADHLLVASCMAILSVMHRRDCLDDTGLFDETLCSHQDLDLWIRLSRKYEFCRIPKVTAAFLEKSDGSSITSANRKKRLLTLEKIHRRYARFASDEIRRLQKKVLVRMYARYGLPVPRHLQ